MQELVLAKRTQVNEPELRLSHQDHELGPYSSLSLTQCYSQEQCTLVRQFDPGMRQAALHFILNGSTIFTQGAKVPPAQFNGDKCNLMLMQPHPTEQRLVGKGHFVMATFYIGLDQFTSLLNVATEALPENFQRAIHRNVCSCNNYRWSPHAYTVIAQLLNASGNQMASRIFMESKMLELISILLEGERCDYFSSVSISRSDVERIRFIHEYMMGHLAEGLSLHQLARLAGTNEFVLKKGFKEVFGKPVYQYLMQKRMEKAMEHLLSTDLPVGTIAFLVGYEDTSAFIRAFKRMFALLPSDVRRQKITA